MVSKIPRDLREALEEILRREAMSDYSSIYAAPAEFAEIARQALRTTDEDLMISEAPVYDSGCGSYVYVCNKCYQPIPKGQICNSGLHVGPDGRNWGRAIRSIDIQLSHQNRAELQVEFLVQDIIADLTARKGLRQEWNEIDSEIRAEIVARWEEIVSEHLQKA